MIVLFVVGIFLICIGIIVKHVGDAMWEKQQADLREAARFRAYRLWLKANHPEYLTNK